MSSELTPSDAVFHFDKGRPGFEDMGKPNGATRWLESDVRSALGYQSDATFSKAIHRAKQTCLSMGIACEDHFHRQADGTHLLTRFGCYLVAMNGDTKKPQVAAAQAYFAAIAETFQDRLEHSQAIERVMIRDEVTDEQKSLASTAKRHGVQRYSFFLNQGYLGMHNMSLDRLSRYKGIDDKESLIDRMDKTELAAHLFRITQTELKIKNESIRGQTRLEKAARDVGLKVRHTVIELSGTAPEDLAIAPHIGEVKKKIKGTNKKLASLDKPKRPKK